jgi:anhydro-N-acetylmuramic acid kinase
MVYKAIGVMSGSSLDGLDIAYVHFQETGGKWTYDLLHFDCHAYTAAWIEKLKNAIHLSAIDYQLLHAAYGHYIGQQINEFINTHALHHQVDLIASHGHTTFHLPVERMTGQIGNGAGIAAETGLPVVSDLRAMDVAFGGQGAPIVPIGEKLLLGNYAFFLNLGGIANISFNDPQQYLAFDVCPANRVLNMLMNEIGKEYDDNGNVAASGLVHETLLNELNQLDYYKQSYPKSLANDFGTDVVYPLIKKYNISVADAACTMIEHVAIQLKNAVEQINGPSSEACQLLATGGGALNAFLINRIRFHLNKLQVEVVVPAKELINYKEALVMALMGVLRWREEYNVLSTVTGARRNSINGAIWLGNEA